MAQGFPRFCPRCGAETNPTQRLCPRCGLDLAPWLPQQPPQPPSQPGYPQPSQPGFQPQPRPTSQPGIQAQPEPIPGQAFQPYGRPLSQPGFQQPSQPGFQQPSQPGFQQPSQPGFDATWSQPPTVQQPPIQSPPAGYANYNGPYNAPSSAPVQASRRTGRLRMVLILLVILILLGGAGYLALNFLHPANKTQTTITTSSINSVVTYAGVTMTVLKVEQSQRFIDDPNSSDNGMVRVHLQAQNKTTLPVNLMYNTIVALTLPGGKTEAPAYVKGNIGVAPGATQTSIMDFAVPTDTKVNQLVFNLGAPDETQLNIPLAPGATLNQYAPKTTNLNSNFQYLGLNWSLVNATTQLSIDGKQASKGMHYVTLTLAVSNPLSQTAIPGSPFDYIRLKAGTGTATPVNATLPVSFAAGANDKTGIITFLVPQNTTTLTLILLAQPQSGFDQVTKDFHLA